MVEILNKIQTELRGDRRRYEENAYSLSGLATGTLFVL